MEQRLANSWRMAVNDKKFIGEALLSEIRIDGRGPFEYRRLTIKFGKYVFFFPCFSAIHLDFLFLPRVCLSSCISWMPFIHLPSTMPGKHFPC